MQYIWYTYNNYICSLTDFTEIMRVLGYPRLISVGNFRLPNFPLIAEILVWLVKRFDPDTDIPSDHSTEEERISLIRAVAEFMVKKKILNFIFISTFNQNKYFLYPKIIFTIIHYLLLVYFDTYLIYECI